MVNAPARNSESQCEQRCWYSGLVHPCWIGCFGAPDRYGVRWKLCERPPPFGRGRSNRPLDAGNATANIVHR